MGFDIASSFRLLAVVLSLLFLQSMVESSGTVLFLDSRSNQFIRSRSSDAVSETGSMLLTDVGAAVSVLLGFSPPATLSAASSSKLNEVLIPNPFHRPRAVFMLEVKASKDSQLTVKFDNFNFGTVFKSEIATDSEMTNIELHEEDEVSVVSLDESLSSYRDSDCTDKDITDFASWIGGSYNADESKPLNGKLTFLLPSGVELNFHMLKEVDRELTLSLLSLVKKIRRAIELHQDLLDAKRSPAELLTGCFDGIKVLQEKYGKEGVTQQAVELLLATISKLFDSLQAAYKGEIVGVVYLNRTPYPGSESTLNVKITSRPSPRMLEENQGPFIPAAIVREILVRRTLAWVTGIILLFATLLGIYFLVNMPLTRDTLLYSNVKLD